ADALRAEIIFGLGHEPTETSACAHAVTSAFALKRHTGALTVTVQPGTRSSASAAVWGRRTVSSGSKGTPKVLNSAATKPEPELMKPPSSTPVVRASSAS